MALGLITHDIDHFIIKGFKRFPKPPDRPDKLSQELFSLPNSSPKVLSPAPWARLEEFSLHYPILSNKVVWRVGSSHSMRHLYLVGARAAREMPRLRIMSIRSHMNQWRARHWHGFRYSYDIEADRARATWASSFGFVPDADVVTAWQKVALKHPFSKKLEVEISDQRRYFDGTSDDESPPHYR